MISRHWIGIVKNERVNDYQNHLENETFPSLRKIDGFKRSYYMTRDVNEGTEFLVVTEWDSIDSIKLFAGADYENAVVPKGVIEMMIRFDKRVRHYTVPMPVYVRN